MWEGRMDCFQGGGGDDSDTFFPSSKSSSDPKGGGGVENTPLISHPPHKNGSKGGGIENTPLLPEMRLGTYRDFLQEDLHVTPLSLQELIHSRNYPLVTFLV